MHLEEPKVHQAKRPHLQTLQQELQELQLRMAHKALQQVIAQEKKLQVQKHILKVSMPRLNLKKEKEKKLGIN